MRSAWIAMILAGALARAGPAQTYVMIDLDPTSAFKTLVVTRITEDNALVGVAETLPPTMNFGVSIDAAGEHLLPMLAGDHSLTARSRNGSGDVVGFGIKNVPPPTLIDTRPLIWHLGTPVDLNTLVTGGAPLTLETAESIDSTGAIVGAATDAIGTTRAYRFSQGVVSDLGSPFGATGWANALRSDDLGRVVGASGPTAAVEHATFWASPVSAPVDLHDPTILLGPNSRAYEVDRFGRVCGYAEFTPSPTGDHHATVWVGPVPHDLGAPTGKSSEARGMNDLGTEVGWAVQPATGDVLSSTALIWKNGVMSTLDSMTQLPIGWTIKRAYDVNDRGIIVADAAFISGVVHPVVLVPVCAGWFASYGNGCQGVTGTPLLTAKNCPTPGNTFAAVVTNANPNSFALMCAGIGASHLQIVPTCALEIAPMFNLVFPLMTDALGSILVPIEVPQGVPSVTVNFQVLIADPAANGHVAVTTALNVHVQ